MFDNYCEACEKRQLILPGQVTAMANTDDGMVVSYTCWCGAAQVWHVAGRPERHTPVAA